MKTTKIIWVVLGSLIGAITIILVLCIVIVPSSEAQAKLIQTTVPVTLDIFKIIVGGVVGALGTSVGINKKE